MSDKASRIASKLACLSAEMHGELLSGCRAITCGDEFRLTPAEAAQMQGAVVDVRRASGAARVVARELLAQLGVSHADLSKNETGAPRWPQGFVGSLSHDAQHAVAIVSKQQAVRSVGVDIEPALPLPSNLLHLVATPAERRVLDGDLLSARLVFCIKEAVYKATFPLDGIFLEHHDIEVNLQSPWIRTTTGHTLQVLAAIEPCLVALAAIRA